VNLAALSPVRALINSDIFLVQDKNMKNRITVFTFQNQT